MSIMETRERNKIMIIMETRSRKSNKIIDVMETRSRERNKITIIRETRSREGKKQDNDYNGNKIKRRKETR